MILRRGEVLGPADPDAWIRTLYLRILQHLSNGKAWETALVICKELQHEYETTSFNYSRLSDLLQLQAQLYASIAKGDRHFG